MNVQTPNKQYKTTNTLVYSCQYHVIWATKYRRKVLNACMQERLKVLILEKRLEYNYEIHEMEVMSDHIHLLIDCNPQLGVHSIIGRIKGYTSHVMRNEFKELTSRLPTLWTRSKFISSVGSVSLETVKKYIENQKNR